MKIVALLNCCMSMFRGLKREARQQCREAIKHSQSSCSKKGGHLAVNHKLGLTCCVKVISEIGRIFITPLKLSDDIFCLRVTFFIVPHTSQSAAYTNHTKTVSITSPNICFATPLLLFCLYVGNLFCGTHQTKKRWGNMMTTRATLTTGKDISSMNCLTKLRDTIHWPSH